jgi:hypothetical protein
MYPGLSEPWGYRAGGKGANHISTWPPPAQLRKSVRREPGAGVHNTHPRPLISNTGGPACTPVITAGQPDRHDLDSRL